MADWVRCPGGAFQKRAQPIEGMVRCREEAIAMGKVLEIVIVAPQCNRKRNVVDPMPEASKAQIANRRVVDCYAPKRIDDRQSTFKQIT
ncbi:hypothetical protein AT959_18805 [Dechloromonas denitrificans]|uniref:Uncharacterized protein n=1 Tax=Dechloromonas denitrificans TaxID=281362 RepID=A0A133XE65_9RHOO|nr:hypothetical protein AT959_18805 [Dechloromonas denitrificans]